jgi:anthranilate synthase component 1
MKKIEIKTNCKKMLSDIYTPVGIYLRLRDRFRDTILLESTDYHAAENSTSFICINAIAGIEISDTRTIEFKLPGQTPEAAAIGELADTPRLLWEFMQRFDIAPAPDRAVRAVQGLFGYTTFDAVQFFDTIRLRTRTGGAPADIPGGSTLQGGSKRRLCLSPSCVTGYTSM